MVPDQAQYWFSSTPAIIYSRQADADYGLNFVNENVACYLGYDPQDFIEDVSFWRQHVHPEDLPQVLNQLSQLLQQQTEKTCQYRFLHKDGKYRWIQDHLKLVKSPISNKLEIIGCWQDITQYKETESTLQRQNKLLQGVAAASQQLLIHEDCREAIATALTILEKATNVDSVYLCENSADSKPDNVIMRLRSEQLSRSATHYTCARCCHDYFLRQFSLLPWLDTLSAGHCVVGTQESFSPSEQAFLQQHNILAILLVPIQVEDQLWGFLGFEHHQWQYQWSHSDIETLLIMAANISGTLKRQQQEEQLWQKALLDPLTNLPNRMLFMDRLGQAIQWAKRHPSFLFAVLFLDLDRFKVINDCLGHNIGDQLLLEIAARLTKGRCAGDTVARLGGDEFAILLCDISSIDDAVATAEAIKTALEMPVTAGVHEIVTSVSIGITLSTSTSETPEQFLRDAESAMFQAKTQYRDRHKVFESTMLTRDPSRLQLEMDLRRALERQELQLFYQPIISLVTDKIMGFEALTRWNHPERGIVTPGEFITLAEEMGLILALDRWVLQHACDQLKRWQEQFSPGLLITPHNPQTALTLSINLSGKEFTQPDLAEQIQQVLQQVGVDGRHLNLEITESVLIGNNEFTMTLLTQLRALNVQLHLDDFGAGYSSFAYLHHLPINALKIDRSFVSRMLTSYEHLEIIRTIIALAHNLGLDVIAEGVETAAQAAQLKKLRCEYGQGYYFSRPIPAQQATTLLMKQFHP